VCVEADEFDVGGAGGLAGGLEGGEEGCHFDGFGDGAGAVVALSSSTLASSHRSARKKKTYGVDFDPDGDWGFGIGGRVGDEVAELSRMIEQER